MCGASNNQATKTKFMEAINTKPKVENSERKERENTRNLFTQFGPILT